MGLIYKMRQIRISKALQRMLKVKRPLVTPVVSKRVKMKVEQKTVLSSGKIFKPLK